MDGHVEETSAPQTEPEVADSAPETPEAVEAADAVQSETAEPEAAAESQEADEPESEPEPAAQDEPTESVEPTPSEGWAAPDATPQAAAEQAGTEPTAELTAPVLADQTPTTQTPVATPVPVPAPATVPQTTAPFAPPTPLTPPPMAPLVAPTQPAFPQQGFAQPGFAQPTGPQPTPPQQGWAYNPYDQPVYPQPTPYGYPGYAQQPPQAPPVDPAAAKRKRKRLLWIGSTVVVVLCLIAAGIYVLLPGRTGNSVVSAVKCQPTTLTSCLIKAPAGADLLGGDGEDDWPQQTVSTSDLYASNIVTDSPGVGDDTSALLSQDDFKTLAHVDWNAVDGNNIDIVLLSFGTQKGAQAWNSTRAAEILAAYPGPAVAITGDSTGKAHATTKVDTKGNINVGYSTVVGDIVLNVAYSSPNQLSTPDLQNWVGTELASLRSAPAAAADPAATAPGTQTVACGSGLQSCLMAEPGDGTAWTQPSDSHWISSPTLTSNQFVSLFWEKQSSAIQQQVLSNFSADGVTGISHEDWTIDNGDEQADVYLLQTITAAGATALTTSNFGEPVWGSGLSGVGYTIPNASQTQAWYTNKTDSNGFIDFAYTSTVGNVIAMGWLYFYGSFDSSTANSWTEPELDRLDSSVQTEPMGLFSLTAPALPAAQQGTCASSGDCLLALPSGASDTTSTSYQVGKSLSATAYANQYETSAADEVGTWLASDGFSAGEHRSFTASNGATADAALLKYATPAQAQAAAMLEFGVDSQGQRVCTDPAIPDSLCLAEPVSTTDLLQVEAVRVLAWKGDYEVSVNVSISNSADLVQAYTWAQQQLDMLPAS